MIIKKNMKKNFYWHIINNVIAKNKLIECSYKDHCTSN